MSSRWSSRRVSYMGVLVAAIVALGYLLAMVPNVELATLTAFLAGWILGFRQGAVVGALGILFYSFLSPWGPPLPPVLAAQVGGMALAGVAGAGFRRWAASRTSRKGRGAGDTELPHQAAIVMGAAGASLTVLYDLGTNVGHAVACGLTHRMGAVLLAGMSFGGLHVLSNAFLFALFGPVSIRALERYVPRFEAEEP